MSMSKKQATDLINEGWNRLHPLAVMDWRDYRQIMLDSEIKDERQHRKSCPFDLSPKFSAAMVAKWFVLKAIWGAKGSRGARFTASDILHCKKSYLVAHAVNDDDRFDLDEMFAGYDWDRFLSIDYSQADLVTG